MGIFDALTTAVAGLSSQAFALNNVSGNIANSQTTAFKRVETSFLDQIPSTAPNKQLAGSVTANSRTTNTVQGDIQTASKSTFMAINGQGFFVVQKPDNFVDNRPTFSGVNLFSRRGDFDLDANGFLVNGSGYFLEGIPIDPTTGNLTGSVPQVLQFNNGFLPAQATTNIDYHLNLPRVPQTPSFNKNVLGSDLLNPADFAANPLLGSSAPGGAVAAKIKGLNANLQPDGPAVITGASDLSTLSATGGNFVLKFDVGGTITNVTVTVNANDDANAVAVDINNAVNQAPPAGLGAGANVASIVANHLVLTGRNNITNISVVAGTQPLGELGLSATTKNAINLITQGAVTAGQTLKIAIGPGPTPPVVDTVTFGFGPGQVNTLAGLNTALAPPNILPAVGSASVDASGNLTVQATVTSDVIALSGTADPVKFGVHNNSALPATGSVIANDVATFINESISGGAITAFDISGQPVNVQFRWAKVDSTELGGPPHVDKWNLFYETNSTATGTQPAWVKIGPDYLFDASGKQIPPGVSTIPSLSLTIDGVTLPPTLQISHTVDGLTQFSDPNGTVSPNVFQQNGFPAGQLKSVGVSDKGRITGTFSNGRTVDLAQITLANFSAAESLQRLDGGAYSQTSASGSPTFNAPGKIVGSSLEASNTDIADEFTKLIITQQAYSANTRVITTTNSMVQDLLNVVR